MNEMLRKKLENFWYYYKWYALAGLLLVCTLIVGIRSCTLRAHPDLYLLYACDTSPDALQVQALETWLGDMTQDRNHDGKTTATVLATSTTDQWNGSNSAAMLVQVNAGQAVLYLLTPATYQLLHENEVLQPLDFLTGESPYLEGDRYAISASGALRAAGFTGEGEYYLCLRKVAGTAFEKKASCIEQETLAKDVLQQLIDQEKNEAAD